MEIKIERDEDYRNYEVTGMPVWKQPEDLDTSSWFAGITVGGEQVSIATMQKMMEEGALAADPDSLAEDGTANIYLPIDLEEAIADGKWDVRKGGFPDDPEAMESIMEGAGEMVIRYDWNSQPVEITIQFNG